MAPGELEPTAWRGLVERLPGELERSACELEAQHLRLVRPVVAAWRAQRDRQRRALRYGHAATI